MSPFSMLGFQSSVAFLRIPFLILALASCCCNAGLLNATSSNDTGANPISPWDGDLYECSPIYGDSLNGPACKKAVAKIFPGVPRPITVSRQRQTGRFTLKAPAVFKDDDDNPSCQITVDLAGPPSTAQETRIILSNSIRSKAGDVITNCVERPQWGGFITSGTEKSGLGLHPDESGHFSAPPFITISVNSPNVPYKSPGDTDPVVVNALIVPINMWRGQVLLESSRVRATELINRLEYQGSLMTPGGRQTWWDTEPFQEIVPGGVEYRCDEKFGGLGVMQAQQCRRASWGFIGRGEIPSIAPGSPLVVRDGQCVFKAESTSGTVAISWDALRAAVDVLFYKCLESDKAPLIGGQMVWTGGAGPSTSYDMPHNLLITMGDVGLVGQGTNVTITQTGTGSVGGNITRPGVILPEDGAYPVGTS